MKKIISALLVVFLCLGVASRGSAGPAERPEFPEYEPESKSIVVGIPADPRYLSPWGNFNNGRREVTPMIYQTLAISYLDKVKGEVMEQPVMAKSYEEVADGVFEIVIHEGIYDTADNPFTARDAVWCFETAKEPGVWPELEEFDKIELVDDHTFRMYTNDGLKIGDFLDILIGFEMVTQASYEASPDGMITTPVGTTGFKLTEYVPGGYLLLEKADSYWNDAANQSKSAEDGYCPSNDFTKLDKIRYEIITDSAAMTIALETGAIDIASTLVTSDYDVLQSGNNAGKFNLGTLPLNTYHLTFNVSEGSPTGNYNLRMALAYAMDAEGVLYGAFDGHGGTLNAWSYQAFVDWQDSWDNPPYFEYNPALAREYLNKFYAETGTTANTLRLRLLNQSGGVTQRLGEVVQAYIVELVGNPAAVEIISYERSVYEGMLEERDEFDLCLLFGMPLKMYSSFGWERHINTATGNDVFHSHDPVLRSLLAAASDIRTHSDANVTAFQAYVNEQAYLRSLIRTNSVRAGASWIHGLDDGGGPRNMIPFTRLDYDWSRSGR